MSNDLYILKNNFQFFFQDFKTTVTEFSKNFPLLRFEINFDAISGFYINKNRNINKLFPLTRFMNNSR